MAGGVCYAVTRRRKRFEVLRQLFPSIPIFRGYLFAMERTLVLIKPDAVQRSLIGEIISRIEKKGLMIVALKMMYMTDRVIADHYQHLTDKPFFPELSDFMKSTPVIAACVEGLNAIETVRRVVGITLSRQADPGTIRGDLAMSVQCNLVHASDSAETAQEELKRFFQHQEIFEYKSLTTPLIYAGKERTS